MTTFVCPGYEEHPCGKTVERTVHNQKRCPECLKERKKSYHTAYNTAYKAAHKEEIKARDAAYKAAHKEEIKLKQAAYSAAHKEEKKVRTAAYHAAHKEERKAYRAAHREEIKAYRAAHREEISVRGHHREIFGTKKTSPRKSYEGMPFEDAWNPKKGGSFRAGGEWITANLGKKPEGCTLHVVDHAKGFVPGNLVWSDPVKQCAEQMFKIIARQRHEIKELQMRIRNYEIQETQTKTRAA
jgi:hypothetical protein